MCVSFDAVATLHSGACLPGDEYCKTNILYEPVCGSDGATYTNLESLLCVNYRRLRSKYDKSPGWGVPPRHVLYIYRAVNTD